MGGGARGFRASLHTLILFPMKAENTSPRGNTLLYQEAERHLYGQRGERKAEKAVQETSKPCYFTTLLPQANPLVSSNLHTHKAACLVTS